MKCKASSAGSVPARLATCSTQEPAHNSLICCGSKPADPSQASNTRHLSMLLRGSGARAHHFCRTQQLRRLLHMLWHRRTAGCHQSPKGTLRRQIACTLPAREVHVSYALMHMSPGRHVGWEGVGCLACQLEGPVGWLQLHNYWDSAGPPHHGHVGIVEGLKEDDLHVKLESRMTKKWMWVVCALV